MLLKLHHVTLICLKLNFMRFISLAILLFTSYISAKAQSANFNDKSKIYLVRHAEKLSGKDPLLTLEGNNRAGDLFRALKDKKIKRIYVTEYKRTQNTGDSLRIYSGIDTVLYSSDTSCTDLLNKIVANNDLNDAILIIGHSNTIPIVIQKLGLAGYPSHYIADNEFDNLFLMRFKKGKPLLKKLKYGKPSAPSATMK